MKFPSKKYNNFKNFFKDYFLHSNEAVQSIDIDNLREVVKLLEKSYSSGVSKLLVCGNGGSAAISNHFACDHQKILFVKNYKPFIISLSSNSSLITAIANDINYSSIFSEQVKYYSKPKNHDLLLVISSSGNSKNVINAIKVAKMYSLKTISLTGFDGGRVKKISDFNIHVNSYNYGIIESIHHSIMNIISQYLRNNCLSKKQVSKIFF